MGECGVNKLLMIIFMAVTRATLEQIKKAMIETLSSVPNADKPGFTSDIADVARVIEIVKVMQGQS